MNSSSKFSDKKIALDSNFLIYHVEGDEEVFLKTTKLLKDWYMDRVQIILSVIAVTECFVAPLMKNDFKTFHMFEDFFNHVDNLKLVAVTKEIAIIAAELRAKYGTRTPDGIHLATAIHSGADLFVSSDKRLKKLKEIKVVDLMEI